MLVDELLECFEKIKSLKPGMSYYNKYLGDTSFLLAGLLGSLLKLKKDWNPKKWIDDSLLTGVKLDENKLSIFGVIIWGMENTTEQWTEPFYFEIEFENTESDFKEYTFYFGDLNNPELSYEEFRMNRNYWEQNDRDWKYILNKKSDM